MSMLQHPSNQEINVDFIRLLFTDPVEEKIAYRWACRLAQLVGEQSMQLRPGTTLAQMLSWAAKAKVDSIDFVLVFEPELKMDLASFLDYDEHATFREMVQHYANRFGS